MKLGSPAITIVLLSVLSGLVAADKCSAAPEELPQIAITKEWLRTKLDSHSEFNKKGTRILTLEKLSARDQYCVAGYKRGLAALEGAKVSDFDRPMVLTAVREETDASPIALVVNWLSTKECTEIFVQDAEGRVLVKGAMFTPFDSETVSEQEGLLQYGLVRMSPVGDRHFPLLELNPSDLNRDIWIGVIAKDGSRTKPIRAFVAEQLRTDIKNSRSKPEAKHGLKAN